MVFEKIIAEEPRNTWIPTPPSDASGCALLQRDPRERIVLNRVVDDVGGAATKHSEPVPFRMLDRVAVNHREAAVEDGDGLRGTSGDRESADSDVTPDHGDGTGTRVAVDRGSALTVQRDAVNFRSEDHVFIAGPADQQGVSRQERLDCLPDCSFRPTRYRVGGCSASEHRRTRPEKQCTE
jgi:hypothetical protein